MKTLISVVALTLSAVGATACGVASEEAFDSSESALTSLGVGVWTPVRVGARGKTQLSLRGTPGAKMEVSWTDHYGVRPDRPRPRATVDVRLLDDSGRALTPIAHNSERNDNGLAPDPLEFVVPPSGRARLELVEVDGYSDTLDVILGGVSAGEAAPRDLVVTRAGATDDVAAKSSGGVLLAGGGKDVDEAMRAALEAAGRGDAVVLRMDDTGGAYAPYLVGLGAHAATEIAFDPAGGNDSVTGARLEALRRLANEPWVERRLDSAELVFFAGGNQTKYVDVFSGTKVAAAVDRLVRERHGVVGGTSAGMHVLGGIVHTPRGSGSSVTSEIALRDPYIAREEYEGTASLELSQSPFAIPGMENFVMDTHFANRGRLGRLVTFFARVSKDGLRPHPVVRALACDEGTAVFVDAAGNAKVFGAGDATVLRAATPPETCADGRALSWRSGLDVSRTSGKTPAAVDLGGASGRRTRAVVVDGVLGEK